MRCGRRSTSLSVERAAVLRRCSGVEQIQQVDKNRSKKNTLDRKR